MIQSWIFIQLAIMRLWRGRGVILQQAGVFALLIFLLGYIAPSAAPAAAWLALLWSLLGLQPWWLEDDLANGALEVLQAKPGAVGAWMFGKWLAAALGLAMPLAGVCAMVSGAGWGIFLVGSAIFLAASLLAASLNASSKNAGALGYILMFPMMLPSMLFGIGAANDASGAAFQMLLATALLFIPMAYAASLYLIRLAIRQQA